MNSILRKVAAAAAGTVLALGGVQVLSSPASAMCPPDLPHCLNQAPTPREVAISRAKTWLTAGPKGGPVPYDNDVKKGGYRTDCSGYVSMALELPKGEYGGPNTQVLATSTYTTKITMSRLIQGDLVIDPTGGSIAGRHVVIFDKWADAGKTKYWAYDQNSSTGTTYKVRTYGVGSDEYDAYRPKKY